MKEKRPWYTLPWDLFVLLVVWKPVHTSGGGAIGEGIGDAIAPFVALICLCLGLYSSIKFYEVGGFGLAKTLFTVRLFSLPFGDVLLGLLAVVWLAVTILLLNQVSRSIQRWGYAKYLWGRN